MIPVDISPCSGSATQVQEREAQSAASHAPGLGERLWSDFPILDQEVNGKPLAYLDNAATSQKPRQVCLLEILCALSSPAPSASFLFSQPDAAATPSFYCARVFEPGYMEHLRSLALSRPNLWEW